MSSQFRVCNYNNNYIKLAQLYKLLKNSLLDLPKMKAIITTGYDINYKIPFESFIAKRKTKYIGNNILHFVATFCDNFSSESCFKFLLQCGSTFTDKNEHGFTPLLLAFYKGIIIKSLLFAHLESNNSTNVHCQNSISHFQIACSTNLVEVVEFFIKSGVPINERVNDDSPKYPGYTALHFAAKHGQLQTIQVLLRHNADFNCKDAKGMTPLDLIVTKSEDILENIYVEKILRLQKEYFFYKNDREIHLYDDFQDSLIDKLTIEKREELSKIKFTDGTLLLDVLQAMRSPCDLKFLFSIKNLNTFIPFESDIWPGYSILHFGVLFDFCVAGFSSDFKADIVMANKDGMSPLHLAFYTKRNDAVKAILKEHEKFAANPISRDNLSHLHIACAAGDIKIARLLLDNQADPNLPTLRDFQWNCKDESIFIKAKSTPLHFAVYGSHFQLILIILKSRGNPFLANENGLTPFQMALERYCTAVKDKSEWELMLNEMTDDALDLSTWMVGAAGAKILRDALSFDHESTEIVVKLVREFEREKLYEVLGLTRLQVACCIGDLAMVQEELESGADVNHCISFDSHLWPGDSAMHCLFRKNSERMHEILKLLIAYGANPKLKNAINSTPIHLCKPKALGRAIYLLYKDSTCFNEYNDEGLYYFHLFCGSNKVNVVENLLKTGFKVNSTLDYFADNYYAGWTPLHFAIYSGNQRMIELLLNHGADHQIVNADCFTPLHLAVSRILDTDIPTRVEAILRSPNINIQETNIFGDTVLMAALKNVYNENLIQLLLNKNARISLTNLTAENDKETNFIFETAKKLCPQIFSRLVAIIPALTATDDLDRNVFHRLGSTSGDVLDLSDYKKNLEILIKKGCELDHIDIKGQTPLYIAARFGDYDTSNILLALGADPRMENEYKQHPYFVAIQIEDSMEKVGQIFAFQVEVLKKLGLCPDGFESPDDQEKYFNEDDVETISHNVRMEKHDLDIVLKNLIDKSLSASYLLDKEFPVKYKRMWAPHRRAICALFNCEELPEHFPYLISVMNMQLRTARARTRLWEPAKNAFYAFIDLSLPDLCLDIVFNYLSNMDLMNLIRSMHGKLIFAPLPKNC